MIATLLVLVPLAGAGVSFATGMADRGFILLLLVLAVMLATVALLVIVVGWWAVRDLARLAAGNYGERWCYDREGWDRFAAREWPHVRRRGLRDLDLLVAVPLAVVLTLAGIGDDGRPRPITPELGLVVFLSCSSCSALDWQPWSFR